MIEAFVDRVLLRRPLTRRAGIGWSLFLLLGPVAYFSGSLLEQRAVGSHAVVALDRDGARATAEQFAAAHGIDARNWSAYASIVPAEDLLEYYRVHRDPAALTARSFAPAITPRVLLVSPAGDQVRVRLNPSGVVNGFDFTQVKAATAGELLPEAQAEAIARQSVAAIPNLSRMITLGKPQVDLMAKTGPGCRKYTWQATASNLPGLQFEIVSGVCGATAVERTVNARIDSPYAAAHRRSGARALKILEGFYVLYIVIVVCYSIYRYARRTLEHEISHLRTALIALGIGLAMGANFLTALDEYVFGVTQGGRGVLWLPLAAIVVTFMLMGLFVAVAYGAGEGDLRELYPGKMTSLDTLLRGKLFSRNVGRSALFGTAYAAWMLLLKGLADYGLRLSAAGFASDTMKLPFFHFPLFAVFAGQAIFVTLIPATGLLLPLAFLGRRVRHPRLRATLMVLFAVLGCMMSVVSYGTIQGALAAIAVLTATMLGAFFGMDLLASIFGLGALGVTMSMARLVSLSPSLTQLAVAVGVIGFAFLALEGWAAVRGREYRDEEVRPAYAGNILLRQQMQAELAAAREAQLHLLPKSVPQVQGLSITAACVPARIVGGDFYDFYPLGDRRLGIFIAEGGNRGIGSALNIALAKGFLMHTVRRNFSPREVIQRLEASLGPLLESAGAGATTHVAYAVIDTAAGTIRYARTGDYPRVLLSRTLGSEQKLGSPGGASAVYEGGANLVAGDTVLLFTDGIARKVSTTGPAAVGKIMKTLARKRGEAELDDDLTAVVIQVTDVDAVMEVVA